MIDNLNCYRVFYAVAETRSFSKAAERLYISQPAVSKSIQKLEEELKTSLLLRNAHVINLTNEGEILFSHLKTAFTSIGKAEDTIRKITELGIGELKLGASTSLCRYVLLNRLQGFIADHPHLKLSIDAHATMNTIKELAAGNLDLGLICETQLPTGFTYVPFMKVHDIFIGSKSYLKNLSIREEENSPSPDKIFMSGNIPGLLHADQESNNDTDEITGRRHSVRYDHSNNRRRIKQWDTVFENLTAQSILEKGNIMMLEKQNVTRIHIDSYLDEQAISPHMITEINNMDILLDFAKIGMGVSAVVREFSGDILNHDDVIEIPLPEPIPPRTVGFAFNRNIDPSSPAMDLVNRFV